MARSTSLADPSQISRFITWLNEEVTKSGCSKTRLARALNHDSIAHINKILSGKIMPSPQTLRCLCDTMEISWAGAFAIAGYFGELLEALVDLANLGLAWSKADGATHPLQFSSFGIVGFNNMNVREAFASDKILESRYLICSWSEIEMETVISTTDSDGNALSPEDIARMEAYAREPRQPHYVIMPKPTAAALLVAAAGFPRRGDIYKDGVSSYAADLLVALTSMISKAQEAAKYRRKLPSALESARAVLADSSVPFESRRPIAAEYVVAWADSVCRPFTYYTRLAAFELFGEVGSSLSTMTPYTHLPQILNASLPDARLFSSTSQTRDAEPQVLENKTPGGGDVASA
jgi:hypothetical protein